MKVYELIAKLKNFDANAEVHFSYNYGDHGRFMIAPVVENVDELPIIRSSYLDDYRLADDEERDQGKYIRYVVVIQSWFPSGGWFQSGKRKEARK